MFAGTTIVLTPDDFSSRALTGARLALLWRRAPCSNELICDTASETVEDGHQPVNGETSKMRLADTRKLAGLHAGQSFGLHEFQKKSKMGIKTS
jgi:hypothetical protein